MSAYILMSGMALFSLWLGFSGTLGYRRRDYLIVHPWTAGINYASIPLGVSIFPILIGTLFLDTSDDLALLFFRLAFILAMIAIIFSLWQPKFLQPKWYKWLRNNHDDIWPLLTKEAINNYSSWYKQTQTIEELEAWVQEVRAKHNR